MTQLFEKRGRCYFPWGNGGTFDVDHDGMAIGEFRLIHCPEPGHYRCHTNVTPDRAAFLAAAGEAQHAMEKAMAAAAVAKPQLAMGEQLTAEQLAIIDRYRAEMAAAGALLPRFWVHASASEIAQAGIDAVRERMEP